MGEFFEISLIAAMVMSAAIGEAGERPISLDDIIDMKSVGGNFHLAPDGFEETVLMSPDGEQVFYSVSVADWERWIRTVLSP